MDTTSTPGKIILINGASSAGKTTLAVALQKRFEIPFIRFSFDLFLDFNALPMEQIKNGTFGWRAVRPLVLNGLHQYLPALVSNVDTLIAAWQNRKKPSAFDKMQIEFKVST